MDKHVDSVKSKWTEDNKQSIDVDSDLPDTAPKYGTTMKAVESEDGTGQEIFDNHHDYADNIATST